MISLSSHLHFNSHMDLFNAEHYLIHHVFQEYLIDKVREWNPLRLEENLYHLDTQGIYISKWSKCCNDRLQHAE